MASTRGASTVMPSSAPQYQPVSSSAYRRYMPLGKSPAYSSIMDAPGSRAWQLGPVAGRRLSGTLSALLPPQGVLSPANGAARSGPMDPSSPVFAQLSSEANFKSVDASTEKVLEVKGAKPQMVDGIEYWPEKWGITREQCLALWNQLRKEVESGDWDPDFDVYQLVRRRIIPQTKDKGQGYALLLNKDDPKEVNIMVSHAWNENALEFLEAICRSTADNEVLFICAFSIYQCEDDAGPSISAQLGNTPEESPFKRVLQFIDDKGRQSRPVEFCYKYRTIMFYACDLFGLAALCMLYAPPVFDGVVYTSNLSAKKLHICLPGAIHPGCELEKYSWEWGPIWPAFRLCWPLFFFFLLLWAGMNIAFVYAPARMFYRGRMIVVPNRNGDLYARLWCVYEIFIARSLKVPCDLGRTMARSGLSSVREATCSSMADQSRIQQQIDTMDGEGYDAIDESITELTKQLNIGVFRLVCTLGFPNIVIGLAYYNLYDPNDCKAEFWGDTSGLILVIIGLVTAYYKVFKLGQGIASARALCTLAFVQLSLGIIFEILRQFSLPRKARCISYSGEMLPTPTFGQFFLAFVFGFSKAARMGFFVSAFFSSMGLAYTFINRRPRAFHRHPCHLLMFLLMGVIYVTLRATVMGKHRLSDKQWADPTQALPELFAIITEFVAGIGCPLNSIWKASLYWGLTVDWEDFWKRKDVVDMELSQDSNQQADGEIEKEDSEIGEPQAGGRVQSLSPL